MGRIVKFRKIDNLIKKMKDAGQSIVLVGGCFDLLHFGHIKFLEEAKKQGDILFVALESDEKIKKLKGKDRPIHSQEQRAEMLSALEFVNLVICLPLMKNDKDYFDLVKKVRPDIIAVTKSDPQLKNKQKQAKEIGAKVKIVTSHLKTPSTSVILNLIQDPDSEINSE